MFDEEQPVFDLQYIEPDAASVKRWFLTDQCHLATERSNIQILKRDAVEGDSSAERIIESLHKSDGG